MSGLHPVISPLYFCFQRLLWILDREIFTPELWRLVVMSLAVVLGFFLYSSFNAVVFCLSVRFFSPQVFTSIAINQSYRARMSNKKHLSVVCSNIFNHIISGGSNERCYVLNCWSHLDINTWIYKLKFRSTLSRSSSDFKPNCLLHSAKIIKPVLPFQYFNRELYTICSVIIF